MRKICLILSLIYSFATFAKVENIKEIKLELIKEMKILFEKNQTLYPLEITEDKTTFLFKLINDAYASSSYQCLYGGWPSTTIKVNGKTYCHDARKSDFYRKSYACKSNEFTCPPVLFGKDVCVPYNTRKERISVYGTCEKNQKIPAVTSDWKSDDFALLVEYVKLSNEICNAPASKKNVVKVNCEKVLQKTKDFEDLIRKDAILSKKLESKTEVEEKIVIVNNTKIEDCVNCEGELKGTPDKSAIKKISDMSPRLIYETLKKNYRDSKLCDPIYNYPPEDAKGIALSSLNKISKACSTWGKELETIIHQCDKEVARVKSILNPDDETSRKWDEYKSQLYATKDEIGMYKIMLSAKKMVSESQDSKLIGNLAKDTFLENNVLIEEEGEVTCPFPSFDAFNKGFTGYNKLKGKLGKKILTIADYTMPSNQRRMFTFDMNKLAPLFNTWVAHGSGNGPEDAASSDGSNPPFSNVPNTNLSSDGFVIARNAASGSMFGDNILLDGVDKNNSNMRKRAIVLHGDSKTGGAYKAISFNQEVFKEKMNLLKNVNINTTDPVEIRKAASAPGYFYPTIGVSWGCLGVPDAEALNLKTGKYESQLQTLRRELAGNTLIFSYSGENMTSKYF